MIKSAAIRKDGKIYTGTKHCYILSDKSRPFGFLKGGEQGFVTETGEFVDRETAAKIAFECNQISYLKKRLYSEDIFLIGEFPK